MPVRTSYFTLFAILLIPMVLAGCPNPEGGQDEEAPGTLWLQFAQITDTHSLDEESPARAVRFDAVVGSAWRPQEAYLTQTLDATVRVLNLYHTGALRPRRALDFVIHTGDALDNAQYNELQWFMGVMDGKRVRPDSGDWDGAKRPGPASLNPKLPFQATGLLPGIPWYMTHGNHDTLCIGTFGIDRAALEPRDWIAPMHPLVAALMGLPVNDGLMSGLLPTDDWSPAVLTGSQEIGNPLTGQPDWDLAPPGAIVPDDDRHFIDAAQLKEACFQSTSLPIGHGFRRNATGPLALCYTVRPKASVPIRLVVLDTVVDAPPNGGPLEFGVMTKNQFEHFLKPALDAARAAQEWVILVSHHPSANFDLPSGEDSVSQSEFRQYVSSQPNVIAHLCGHTHRNHLEWVSGARPYPEIETCSTADSPQEARIYSIYHDEATLSITLRSRLVSHRASPTPLSLESNRRSILSGFSLHLFKDATSSPSGVTVDPEERNGKPEDRDFAVTVAAPVWP